MNILRGKRILIVEADALSRLAFRLVLTKAGSTVEFDGGGESPVLFQPRAWFDLILLDLELPRGQCGFTLFQVIRAMPAYHYTPILAVSAVDSDSTRLRAQGIGFHGFVAKPIDADQLPRDLAHVLRGNDLWVDGPPISLPFDESSLPLQTGPLRRINQGTRPLLRPRL